MVNFAVGPCGCTVITRAWPRSNGGCSSSTSATAAGAAAPTRSPGACTVAPQPRHRPRLPANTLGSRSSTPQPQRTVNASVTPPAQAAYPKPTMARLRITTGQRAGEELQLHPSARYGIGRGDVALSIPEDRTLSREHCVVYHLDGHWILENRSQFGVLVGGLGVVHDTVPLEPGQEFTVGSTNVAFESRRVSASNPAQPALPPSPRPRLPHSYEAYAGPTLPYLALLRCGASILWANRAASLLLLPLSLLPVLGWVAPLAYLAGIRAYLDTGTPLRPKHLLDPTHLPSRLSIVLGLTLLAPFALLPALLALWALPVAAERPGVSGVDALRASLLFGARNLRVTLGLSALLLALALAGSLALGVGLLVTIPYGLVILWLAYGLKRTEIDSCALDLGFELV